MSHQTGESQDPGPEGFAQKPELSSEEKKDLKGIPARGSGTPMANIYRVALVAALGGLLYGYNTGVISGTLIQIAGDYGITESYDLLGFSMPGHRIQEFITASILLGAVFGALFAGWFAQRFGRRMTIIVVGAVSALGVVLAALSPEPLTMIGSRLLLGLAVGACTQTVPTYIAELAPPERRGGFVTFFNIAIGIGILSAALINVIFQEAAWQWKMLVTVIPAILLVIGMLPLPESPRWLIGHRHVDAARIVLRWVRPTGKAADREVHEIEHTLQQEGAAGGPWRALGEKWMRPALIAGLSVAVFTQITGLEMMIYYTPTILDAAGFSADFALWGNVGVGVVYLVMTIIGKLIVDRIGRRTLSLVTLPGAAVSIASFGLVFLLSDGQPNPWAAILLLLAFMFFQAGGIQVVGWLTGSEIYPLKIRPAATGLHAATLWGSNLLVTSTALTLAATLTMGGAMLVYAALNVIAWIVIFFRVPETKGRSLEDIESSLKDGTFLPRQQKESAGA